MTHVVCAPCFNCKYTDCVVVCPVECFYEGEQMLYIHPDECIDCEACVPECPVEAIFHEDNVPEEWKEFTALNAELAPTLPVMSTGATDMAYLRAKGIQCYGIGPAIDEEDGPKGFGAHSDQERILESELHRFVRYKWDVVMDLAAAK